MTERNPNAVARMDTSGMATAEIVLIQGDLSVLSAEQRVEYYRQVCESIGLNPWTKPFDYIVLNGKLTLYAKKDATDQIRTNRGISVTKLEREQTPDSYDVTAYGRTKDGREDASLGSVSTAGLRGEALSKMKSETKAKRRLTLSLAGLGWLDETEVGSVPSAMPVVVTDAGEIIEQRPKTLVEAVQRASAEEEPEEAPKEAPRPEAPIPAPEAKEDTTEALPETVELPAVDGPGTDPLGLELLQFVGWVKEAFIPPALVKSTIPGLFGSVPGGVKDLTDQQRLTLQSALVAMIAEARGG